MSEAELRASHVLVPSANAGVQAVGTSSNSTATNQCTAPAAKPQSEGFELLNSHSAPPLPYNRTNRSLLSCSTYLRSHVAAHGDSPVRSSKA
jgi:hypothetical protein